MKKRSIFGTGISMLLLIILMITFFAQNSYLITDGPIGLITGPRVNFFQGVGLSVDVITGQRSQNISRGALVQLNFGAKIEGFAGYVGQSQCDPVAKPGVIAFRTMLLSAFPGTGDDGITRACDIGGTSEHKEGRAWDWAVSAANPNDVATVNQVFAWLFATDKYGNQAAMIRRLGIMYIIWNYHIWSAAIPSDGWLPYNGPNPHTDHVHFSFSWDGANKATSFWSPALSF